MHVFIAKTG